MCVNPSTSLSGEDFEIRDLIFENFKYGIHVAQGGNADPNLEGVKIIDNVFLNNERGIYFEQSMMPFEVRDNQIFGRGPGASPLSATDAGIWIQNTATQVRTFSPVIDGNIIGDHEDYGIIVLGAQVPNLAITDNRIGGDGLGFAAPNGHGILVQGNGNLIGTISDGNEIVANSVGVALVFADATVITGNLIASRCWHLLKP